MKTVCDHAAVNGVSVVRVTCVMFIDTVAFTAEASGGNVDAEASAAGSALCATAAAHAERRRIFASVDHKAVPVFAESGGATQRLLEQFQRRAQQLGGWTRLEPIVGEPAGGPDDAPSSALLVAWGDAVNEPAKPTVVVRALAHRSTVAPPTRD